MLAIVMCCGLARADTIALPLTGLVVELDGAWSVASHWRASPDASAAARGEDTLTRADGAVVYSITSGGRTDRPCPYASPFVIELDGTTWIHDPRARALCHLANDARIELTIVVGADDPEAHRDALRAFADAFGRRRVAPDAPPPLRDARVTRDDDAPLQVLALDTVGLAIRPPDDGFVWRTAEARADRQFDALVRVFPTFPEVQLLVYRHARRHLASCDALLRRQAARATWHVDADAREETDTGAALVRGLGRFHIIDRCAEGPEGLLEVRVATAPRGSIRALEPMIAALISAHENAPLRPGPPLVPARSHTLRWVAGVVGFALGESDTRALAGVELGATFVQRNGVFARAMVASGASLDGQWASGALDIGVALGADPDLTLALTLGLREDHDPILENRTLSLNVELHSGFHRDDAFGWALRVLAFHLASRQPAVAAAPLVIAWDGVFPSGVFVGADLRWVDRPLEPLPGWPGTGLVLGVRVGVADLRR